MSGLHQPWLELCVLIPVLGALVVRFTSRPESARRRSLFVCSLTLVCAVAAWQDFEFLRVREAHDPEDMMIWSIGGRLLVVDELSAPLLPLAALLFLLTHLATLRTKVREFSFARSLVSEAILLATFSSKLPWLVGILLAAGVIPPYLELRKARKPTRVYVIFMGGFVALLVLGQAILAIAPDNSGFSGVAVVLLTAAVLLRSGIAPVHCWMTDLFEHASFGTALLYVSPMVGAYGLVRLVLPVAPTWVLSAVALVSLVTAIYAAGMALVQREARRFFSYLFLSHSSLVLVGLETATPIGLTGSLSLWLSVSVSLTGFGLVMRCVEARTGRISLLNFHGLSSQVPGLAALFLLTGLASIGFPGTAGFVGLELLVEGVIQAFPIAGAFVVIVAALNGLAVMSAYFLIFTGRPHSSTIDLRIRPSERIAVLILTALILIGGVFPQRGVDTRYRAAVRLAQPHADLGRSHLSKTQETGSNIEPAVALTAHARNARPAQLLDPASARLTVPPQP
ncbi:proton-conducting transporter transmembrane domain-containing protein [Tautonia marina]|uniref:proton-conducting transporter transmembrane domain-containing protein n=1 Tax=Tautonia marina TaxID=2653855 RepID=UPI0012607A9F|nr:proton-conducting transporter membrane subunit [Tautonia marina]